jgi:hypothetical protein
MALGNLVQNDRVRVLSGVEFDEPSTKRAAAILDDAGLERPALVVAATDELATLLSFRNLAGVRALPVGDTEVQDYVWAKSVLLTEAAAECLQALDSGNAGARAKAATEAGTPDEALAEEEDMAPAVAVQPETETSEAEAAEAEPAEAAEGEAEAAAPQAEAPEADEAKEGGEE